MMDDIRLWISGTSVSAAIALYALGLALYRLLLHPLSRFPGPKLAAITRFYEGYYDLYLGGKYTFKIEELHKKYGPIVRISPYELHVSDSTFFDVLYRQDAHYDKYSWTYDAFSVNGSVVTTAAHNAHKVRRQPLAPFFSQARVADQQSVIRGHLSKLRLRLADFAESGATFNLGAATTALARDIANDFILNKSYNSLDREDFDLAQLIMTEGAGAVWRLSKFVRFVAPSLQVIPFSWLVKIADGSSKAFFRYMIDVEEDTKQLMAEVASPVADGDKRRHVVREIMESRLPSSEKKFRRVFEEVSVLAASGFETTASVLRLVFFYVFADGEILARLRVELGSASAASGKPLVWKDLEQLPFLSAVLHEALRLSPAAGTRMARINHHADIIYDQWRIPAGTPVGMTTLLMHRDEATWTEPRRFKPDRWLNADGTFKRINKAFAPFSKGTRICLGMHLAWAEMYITLAEIVQGFDFYFPDASPEDFEPLVDQFTIGTRSRGNLMATVTRRQSRLAS